MGQFVFVSLYKKKKMWWLIKFQDGIDVRVETSIAKVSNLISIEVLFDVLFAK